MSFLFKLQRSKRYWQLRSWLLKAKFYVDRSFFSRRENLESLKNSTQITKELLKLTAFSFILTIFGFFLLQFIETLLLRLYALLPDITLLQSIAKYHLQYRVALLSPNNHLNDLLTVIASVSGVFLGLYFTAISVVASTVFARVPSDLRDLLLKEKVGNYYIRSLAVLTSLSIIMLTFVSVGGKPAFTTVAVIAILGCFAIFCFVALGKRAFFFLDPTTLGDAIFQELIKYYEMATIHGFKWSDPAFQSHYQRGASRTISTLKTLINLCNKEESLQGRPLLIIVCKTINLLKSYQKRRKQIPTHSLWYSRVPSYQNTFLSDYSSLTIALETSTAIQPKMIPDNNWLENEIFDALIPAIKSSCTRNNHDLIYYFLETLNEYFWQLGYDFEFHKADLLLQRIEPMFDQYFHTMGEPTKDCPLSGNLMAKHEQYLYLPSSAILGFFHKIRGFDVDAVYKDLESISWSNDKGIYKKCNEPLMLPRLEHVQKGLSFENKAEGKYVSPKWYVIQLILVRYLDEFAQVVDYQSRFLKDFYLRKSAELTLKDKPNMATNQAYKGVELCNKLNRHFQTLRGIIDKIEPLIMTKDLPRPKWEWKLIVTDINSKRSALVQNMALCLPKIPPQDGTDDAPDMFGSVYNLVCDECFEFVFSENQQAFSNVFPSLFTSALIAYDKLREQLKDGDPETVLSLTASPLVDMLEISGYAKIISELNDQQDIWKVCEDTWNKYIESSSKPSDLIQFFISFTEVRQGSFKQTPRDVIRSRWEMRLNHILVEKKLAYPFGVDENTYSLSRHESPTIRALGRFASMLRASPSTVFIVTYLLKLDSANGLSFNDQHDFSSRLTREVESEGETSEKE